MCLIALKTHYNQLHFILVLFVYLSPTSGCSRPGASRGRPGPTEWSAAERPATEWERPSVSQTHDTSSRQTPKKKNTPNGHFFFFFLLSFIFQRSIVTIKLCICLVFWSAAIVPWFPDLSFQPFAQPVTFVKKNPVCCCSVCIWC